MGFFSNLIKEACSCVERDDRNAHIVFPVQRAYIKVKSKYRGLEGKIFCERYFDEHTWYASRRSLKKAMDKLAYTVGDYLVLSDNRAHRIIIRDWEGVIK